MAVNLAIILGRLGQDPELKYTQSGNAVCNFSVATSKKFKDREGNQQEKTEWHRVVVFGKNAENCSKFLSKGRQAYLEGEITTRSWDDKNTGEKRYATEILAHKVQFIGGEGGGSNQQPNQKPKQATNRMAETNFDDIPF